MLKRLLGMGAAAMDTVIFCPILPRDDSFQIIKFEQVLPGGSCANVLTTSASLGAESLLIAKIGDDELGHLFRSSLIEDGVDGRFVITKAGGKTLHTYVLAAESGQHCILINFGDSLMDLKPEEIAPYMLEGVDLFYTDLFPAEAAVFMASMCKERSIPVIICLECPPSFMERAGVSKQNILKSLSLADLIIGGRESYKELAGAENYIEAQAAIYRKFHPRFGAVCTAGEEGAIWQDDKEILQRAAYQITPIDSTGAGDSFLGALIYSHFIEGKSKIASLEFAAAVGAMKCMCVGPRIKVSSQEVEAFIQRQG
jgi:sugar/nucleoside kinase (ribokinase family)